MSLEGEHQPEDVITTFDLALTDPTLLPDARLLIDIRPSDSVSTSPTEDLRLVAEAFPSRANRVGGQCAVLVDGLLQYGLMRMASVFSEGPGVSVEIFTSDTLALAWLGVPEEEDEGGVTDNQPT